ncbi:hypothetical protein [Parachlamydia sp. AcF125]|uniref:hypothetical protein n=1 Tax=Parachlamydia sp. AcF125 TaxID=2795736 RepID=UPI001BCA1273|nr:hypothetical protein [Parachlamydia sp. AcF125]
MEDLKLSDTAFKKYNRCGMGFLDPRSMYFQMVPLKGKSKMLGSIFPEKRVFQDGKNIEPKG